MISVLILSFFRRVIHSSDLRVGSHRPGDPRLLAGQRFQQLRPRRPFCAPSLRHGSRPKLSVHLPIHPGCNFSQSRQKHAGKLGMGFKSRTEFPRQESFFLAGLEVETESHDDNGQEAADFAHDQGRAQQTQ